MALIRNPVCDTLELVVTLGIIRFHRFFDEASHIERRLLLGLARSEPRSQFLDGMWFKAWQAAFEHRIHGSDNGFHVGPTRQESLHA